MMQPKVAKIYVPRVDEIAKEFVEIISSVRDSNLETPPNFGEYLNRWSLESISCIALDTRLKVMDDATQDAKAKTIIQAVRSFFELTYQVEFLPCPWKYYHTPTFKKLMATADDLTYVVMSYVDQAIERLEKNPANVEADQGVLEKLMKIDKHTAKVMAFDMLMAGVDTVSGGIHIDL
jgi:cytochrome P450 family 12